MSVAVRFRSGASRIVIAPERPRLVRMWADAVEGRENGDKIAVLTVVRMDLQGHPQRRERVDLTAVEAILEPDEQP